MIATEIRSPGWERLIGRTPPTVPLKAKLGMILLNLGCLLLPGVAQQPVLSAEKIYVTYGPLDFSLPVSVLEVYGRSGKIEPELAAYSRFFDQKQLEQLRRLLVRRANISPVMIAQFLYSPTGEILLGRIGEVVQTKANQPGFYAIRAAMIQAAASEEGLTPLNVLKKFPTYGIRINTERGLQVIGELNNLIGESQNAIAAIEQQATTEASAQSLVNFSALPDIRKPGSFTWKKQSINLNDIRRRRIFPLDVYLPQVSNQRPLPLVVISHGLADDRETFGYLAQHLASYGFAVAVPEHPGSNTKKIESVLSGFARSLVVPSELVDRPLDIKYLLDELGRLFPGQLNLQKVGVAGQSFGGYTSLALAGAKLNFEQLQKDCLNSQDSLNISLLLQCSGLVLPPNNYQLQDERIKAAIAINPVSSSLFGSSQISQIKIPTMIVAGSSDTVTPALSEQIQPFTWLTTPNKFLVLLKKGTHFSTLRVSEGVVPLPAQALGPNPEIAYEYMKALNLAFFKTYIAGELPYRIYLNPGYAQLISQYQMPLSLVQNITPQQLTEGGNEATPAPSPSPSPSPSPTPSPTP
ncbi:MAG: alpha/beta hydrolase [Crinalium sp.]